MKIWAQSFQIRDNLLDLQNQARVCDFCNLRWNCCKDKDLGKEPTVFFDRVHSTLSLNKGFPPVLTLHRGPDLKSEADDHMCKLQIGFPQLPVAGSGAYFELLRQWMRDCDTTHTNCESPNIFSFPTRLIDVGTSGSPVLRLYETQRGDRMNYFALSHPWGKQPHFCTFPGNIDQFKKKINFNDLPTTFQHAVTVTRELQLRYLWIDSICIIQGPDGDFNEEAKRMEDIFSQAYCVLAASSAFGQSDGFIKPRKLRKCLPFQQDGQNIYVCEFIDDFNQHVLKSPLSQRGWVLQERVLARRTIYFTNTQTYWECGGGVRCETMMKMQNKLVSFLGDPAFPKVAIQTRRGGKIILYQYLYSQYSRLAFTHQEDRPVAIAGLEKRLIHSFRVSGGFGILDDAKHGLLRRSLLWHRARDSTRLEKIDFQGVNSMVPSASSPPSWSWMAYMGAIDYLNMEFGQVEWDAEELHSPWSSSDVGTWSYSGDESGGNRELKVIARGLEVQSMELGKDGSIIYDDPTKSDGLRSTLKCVVLGKSKDRHKPVSDRTHFVLLVTAEASQAARGNQVYSRVGVGSIPGRWICLEKSGTPGRVL